MCYTQLVINLKEIFMNIPNSAMNGLCGKRLASIAIYQILSKYSDEDHILTQAKIGAHLENDYGIFLERKAIGKYLNELSENGFDVVLTPKGAYIERELSNEEIRVLIDGVLSSKYISENQSRALIDHLCDLGGVNFKSTVKHIHTLQSWGKSDNQDLFYNIQLIDEAINENKQIRFIYNEYGIDKKLHPVSDIPYIVSPSQVLLANGSYYLVGSIEPNVEATHFKLDRIKKLEILKRPRARSSITNMPKIDYINTHPYMFSGRVEPISLLVKSEILSDTIEFFGKDIRLVNQPDGRIKVDFKSATAGIYEWALQHGDMCEVLYPQELRDKIRSTIYKMKQTYYKNDDDAYHTAVLEAKDSRKLSLVNIDLSGKTEHHNLHDIKELILMGNNLTNIDFLRNYPNLINLYIASDDIESYDVLKELKRLHFVNIKNFNLKDISFLKGIENLSTAYIEADNLEDFSPLYELKNIVNLNVFCNKSFLIDEEILKANFGVSYARIYRSEGSCRNLNLGIIKKDKKLNVLSYPANLACAIYEINSKDVSNDCEKAFLESEMAELTRSLTQQLEPPVARVFKSYFEQKLTLRESARVLGLSYTGASDAIEYGLRKIRQLLRARRIAKSTQDILLNKIN